MPLTLTPRAKQDLTALLAAALNGQAPAAQLRTSAEELLLKLALGERSELGEKLREALADGRISEQELVRLLALWIDKWPPSKFFASDFVQRLAEKLGDGELTTEEIGAIVSEWLANRFPDGGQLHQLVVAAALGRLDQDRILNAVETYLTRIGEAGVAAALRAILEADAPVTLPAVIQIIVAILTTENRVAAPGVTDNARNQAVINALGLLPSDSKLRAILEAVSREEFGKSATLTLATVGVTADEGLLNAILTGGNVSEEIRRVVMEKLTPFVASKLVGETPEQAKQVTALLIDILSGKKALIAATSERQDLGMTQKQYDLFLKVRRAVYAALLAVKGGARVPAVAQAQPHIFAAAALTKDTLLLDLVSQNQRQLFVILIHRFSMAEVGRAFFEPVSVGTLAAGALMISVYDSILAAHPDLE